MPSLLTFYSFALGAMIGSFLNVVIYRYPREESIVFPGSHCPDCGAAIKAWDNIPIISYLLLLGRCRGCRAAISPRYLLVELANALFYLAIYDRTGPTLAFVPLAAIVSMTIVLIFIDAEIQILPDVIDLPGVLIGLGIAALGLGATAQGLVLANSLLDSALGAAVGASLLLVIAASYKLLRHVEGLGLGDVKMLAMIGAVVGVMPVMGVLFLASISGAIVGIPLAMRHKHGMRVAMPFGVFLGLASLAVLFFGPTLWQLWTLCVSSLSGIGSPS
jgi:leader peptidase (prepilin peptidase) / N-methyltransferase